MQGGPGAGELSSCNYAARAVGCKAMMRIARAKELCPNLVVMPYEFERYSAIALDVYRVLHQVTPHVMVGCVTWNKPSPTLPCLTNVYTLWWHSMPLYCARDVCSLRHGRLGGRSVHRRDGVRHASGGVCGAHSCNAGPCHLNLSTLDGGIT